ncbi:MAG: DnaB-like helicase C-terminal domain-containing protein [Dehalococcoidales bacterium]|nr:DnaB-like helicase C-terminal domain-containing protein [Dehalococcoidales bacterium]
MRNETAEKGIIGCLLLEPTVSLHQCRQFKIGEDWFTNETTRKTWNLIQKIDNSEYITANTVLEESRKRKDEIPHDFLMNCIECAPVATNIGKWIYELRKSFIRRKISSIATMLQFETENPEKDPELLLAQTQEKLNRYNQFEDEHKSKDDVYAEIIQGWKAAKEKKGIGLPTSWRCLNEVLGGYRPGKLYVVASRPGGGKSTFMANEAFNLARDGHHVSIASLEMAETELRGRMLAGSSDKSSFWLDTGRYDFVDIENMIPTAREHATLPININDKYLNIDQLCSWMQYEALKNKSEWMAVDYLQLIPTSVKRYESRNVEVTNNINRLAEMAKGLNIPILILSQLSRLSEQERRPPDLHDLRDSGAIEQAAYAVMFVNHVVEKIDDDLKNEQSEFIIAKHRGGPTGNRKIVFQRNRQRFTE